MDKSMMKAALLEAKQQKGMSWSELAEAIGMAPVWTCSVCLGESSAPADIAAKLCAVLEVDSDVEQALQVCPYKGRSLGQTIPTDPLIYRFYEVMAVYGTSVKEIIHEEFGDGIMSAIDFTLDVEKDEQPSGDRVKIIFNGKFLPYKRW